MVAYAQEVYKPMVKKSNFKVMFDASIQVMKEEMHIEGEWTILAGGDLEPGDRMSITSTIAKSGF